MNTSENQQILRHKREAMRAVLRVASDLELLTSESDWGDWLKQSAQRFANGCVIVLVDGLAVDLYASTMCLKCNACTDDAATARYLLDFGQKDNLERAISDWHK